MKVGFKRFTFLGLVFFFDLETKAIISTGYIIIVLVHDLMGLFALF